MLESRNHDSDERIEDRTAGAWFTVELPNDESLRLLYWGGPECGSPRPSKNY